MFLKFWFHRLRRVSRNRHIRRVAVAGCVVVICIALNSGCFYFFEKQVNDQLTLWDAFWLSFTTITTVGYGDYSPETVGGRIATLILLYGIGLASFPYVLAQIVDTTVEGHTDRRYGFINCRDLVEGHIILVNFPSELKVAAIIGQLASDARTAHRSVVILTDSIEELPFNRSNVFFVRGSPMQEESWERASLENAHVVLVLSPQTDSQSADAITAATISLVEILNTEIRTIAECQSVEHLALFRSFRCSAVIPTNNIAAKILAQEVTDQGIAPAVAELLTQAEGSELYSETLAIEGVSFNELRSLLAKLKAPVILVGIIRDNQHQINPPPDLQIQQMDRLILISNRRSDWQQIHAQLLSVLK
ncbi:MAG: ion channel [Candidatus Poribacteria bacterium]|nr:ion channel [Candidatus Poribacteria bacterium]